jgi:hypothetical protein
MTTDSPILATTAVAKPAVAQPFNQLVAITRTARRRLQHPTLDFIGLLRVFKTFNQPSCALAGAAQDQQEQKDREGNYNVPQRGFYP